MNSTKKSADSPVEPRNHRWPACRPHRPKPRRLGAEPPPSAACIAIRSPEAGTAPTQATAQSRLCVVPPRPPVRTTVPKLAPPLHGLHRIARAPPSARDPARCRQPRMTVPPSTSSPRRRMAPPRTGFHPTSVALQLGHRWPRAVSPSAGLHRLESPPAQPRYTATASPKNKKGRRGRSG